MKAQKNTELVAGVRERIKANRNLIAERVNYKCFGRHAYMNMRSHLPKVMSVPVSGPDLT